MSIQPALGWYLSWLYCNTIHPRKLTFLVNIQGQSKSTRRRKRRKEGKEHTLNYSQGVLVFIMQHVTRGSGVQGCYVDLVMREGAFLQHSSTAVLPCCRILAPFTENGIFLVQFLHIRKYYNCKWHNLARHELIWRQKYLFYICTHSSGSPCSIVSVAVNGKCVPGS